VYVNVPDTIGEPEIVIILPDQLPVNPAGKPVKVAPVATAVEKRISLIGENSHTT
jgi:hypothetical protein